MNETGVEGSITSGGGRFPYLLSVENSSIHITAELPGVSEEMIRIDLDGKVLTISVDGKGRRYREDIGLPFEAGFGRKRFSNGVLELLLEKAA